MRRTSFRTVWKNKLINSPNVPLHTAAALTGLHCVWWLPRYTFFDKCSASASAHLRPSHPKPMMQSLHVLRFALHGGQRHGSTSNDRSVHSEQEIVPTPCPIRLRDTALAALLRCLLHRPVIEPLPLSHTLLPASRSESDLCSNCSAAVRSLRSPHVLSRQLDFHWLRLVDVSRSSAERSQLSLPRLTRNDFHFSLSAVRRSTRSIAPMTAAAALLSSFVRAVLTWRHRTVTSTRQAGRRHFFGGIATNCLNNSKSAPLSPSSSPFRTASSSPHIAALILAFGKR